MNKTSFIFYESFYELSKLLKKKDRLAFYDAIVTYALRGLHPTFGEEKVALRTAWNAVYPILKSHRERYENAKKSRETEQEKQVENELKTEENRQNNTEKENASSRARTRDISREHFSEKEKGKENEKANEEGKEKGKAVSLPSFMIADCPLPPEDESYALLKKIENNGYLREWKFLSKYLAKKEQILAGYYDEYFPRKGVEPMMEHRYTAEQLNRAFVNAEGWDCDDDFGV